MFSSKHRLQYNITARYIRVLSKDWITRPRIGVELYGCEGMLISYPKCTAGAAAFDFEQVHFSR